MRGVYMAQVRKFGGILINLGLLIPCLVHALPSPIALPTTDGSLLAKATPDECFDGIGVDYPDGGLLAPRASPK